MPFFEQILPWAAQHGGTLLFGLVWIFITGAAAIWVASAVGQVAIPRSQKATRRPVDFILLWRRAGAPRDVAALTFLAVFLTSYMALILVWEDFAYYDNSDFTLLTLRGHNIQVQIIPEIGRFYPLGGQEFSLIRHLTDTITGYHALPIVQLLIFSWILLIIDNELSIMARAALVILVLLTPGVLISFNGLIFQERNILFFLACLVLIVKRFEQTQSITWAVAAVVCAQIMIYTKETAFLLILGFAASRVILRCRNIHFAGSSDDRLWNRESRLDLCLASLAALFVILYLGFMGIDGNMNYATAARIPRADIMLGYARVDLLPWLLAGVVLFRIYLILRGWVAPLLLWDGLAFGGLSYLLAYLYLSIFGVYYLAPVDLIAVLYIGRLAVLSWKKMRPWRKAATMLLGSIIILQDLAVSAFAVFERKNVIDAKAEIASAVKTQYRHGAENHLRLFFPFAYGYVIMEFGAYLNYRGVPVEGVADEASPLNSVILARPTYSPQGTTEHGLCVEWRRIRCQAC